MTQSQKQFVPPPLKQPKINTKIYEVKEQSYGVPSFIDPNFDQQQQNEAVLNEEQEEVYEEIHDSRGTSYTQANQAQAHFAGGVQQQAKNNSNSKMLGMRLQEPI